MSDHQQRVGPVSQPMCGANPLGGFQRPLSRSDVFFLDIHSPKTEVFLGFTVSYFGGKQWISIVWYLHHVKSSFSMIKLAFCRVKNASTCTNHASFSASPLKRHGKNQRFQQPKSSIPEGVLSLQPHLQPPFWPRAGISSIMFARLEFSKNMFNKNSLWCSICSFYFQRFFSCWTASSNNFKHIQTSQNRWPTEVSTAIRAIYFRRRICPGLGPFETLKPGPRFGVVTGHPAACFTLLLFDMVKHIVLCGFTWFDIV